MNVEMGEIAEKEKVRPKVTDAKGILQQNREFLDFFWDIAKPVQEIRLSAIENLIQYLKKSEKPDELEYSLKRLVDGLSHTREVARPGFSLALGQLLMTFGDIPLQSLLDRIKQKHNLQNTKKKLVRNALFGNFFGVLALSQSNRLAKESKVVLGCIKLLQTLSQHRDHLKDLPTKTMMDILSDTPEEVFEEVLKGALKTELSSAFRTPEQLHLLLVAMQRFPRSFTPKNLNKLLGSSAVITADNVQKLSELLKTAAFSVKKDCTLPTVAVDLLKLSLTEGSFTLFWTKVIVGGMLREQQGPTHYLAYRLLGTALPLLSLEQLEEVLSGDVMRHYGEHVTSAQKPGRFQLAPEMETYVTDFLQGSQDPDKQLAVVVGFSKVTNWGNPVVASSWRAVQHLGAPALRRYVCWLKTSFLVPTLDAGLEFSTRKQKTAAAEKTQKENQHMRLRKWLVARLISLVENHSVKKDEDLVMDVARFVFFHAFFVAKKATSDIPETEAKLSVPLDESTRATLVGGFFGLLHTMHHLPLLGEPAEPVPAESVSSGRRVQGVTADGSMWIHCLVQYADALLNKPKHVQSALPFSAEQRTAWDGMNVSVASLMKKAKKEASPEIHSFQQLLMLVGFHLFKNPEELVDILQDIQSCIKKAQEKKKKRKSQAKEELEPHWAEVVVDILLSLLSQSSRHIRQVCKTVFASICPHVTAASLTIILELLDTDKDDALVVTNQDPTKQEGEDQEMKDGENESSDEDEEEEEEDEEEEDEDDDEDDVDDDEEEEAMVEGEVDPNFRLELMKVLQQQNALPTEEDVSDEEDLDDEAMMSLDAGLAALFSEQKKKMEAKREQKFKVTKERTLIIEFKMKVLDLLEVFVSKQAGSPLVLGLVEPLLGVLERSHGSDRHQQDQDFLRRVADIFRNQLCRSKVYCKTAGDRQAELHDLLEKLVHKAQKHTDSSVSLYFFSASLYLVKVLRGGLPSAETTEGKTPEAPSSQDLQFLGSVEVERVSALFREALCSLMTRRNSPLTGQMFVDLCNRFPALGVNILDTAVQNITAGVREHQQGQACMMVLRMVQNRDVQQLLAGQPWLELCVKLVEQLVATLKEVGECQSKVSQEKLAKALELCQFLLKNIKTKNPSVSVGPLQVVLGSLAETISLKKTGGLDDTYWAVMKHFGVIRPKVEKVKKPEEPTVPQATSLPKKKGFLPESKKRKNRNKQGEKEGEAAPTAAVAPGDKGPSKKKNKRKPKRKLADEGASPAKKAKPQSGNKPGANKKSKKQGAGAD
ncbi:myb-binding protein 1A-like protein [Gadus morhua]|nr:myb-binding protein 1A [Gadus morhua]